MPKIRSRKIKNNSKEISEYPKTNSILFTDKKRSYYYTIRQEGLYPQPPILAYTQGKNKYKIPDGYCVETTWDRGEKKRTVKCFINYIEERPIFRIMYGINFSEEVQSNISSTTAANAVLRKLFPLNEKSLISGVHLFGIHLVTLKQARENISIKEDNIQLIPLENCSKSTLNKRQRKFGHQLKQHVESEANKVYGNDKVILKKISYSVRDMDFQINYEEKNDIKEKKLISVAKAIDFNYIPREGYRALTSVEQDLQREWAVSKQRLKITTEMNQKIPITLVDLPSDFTEYTNSESFEIIQNIKKGGTRSVKDILRYIVPVLISNEILDINNPIIHLRVSGDGRNVSRVEKYEVLETMMASFIKELDEIKTNGLIIGFNSANSKFFCPWCQISKFDQGNNWKIKMGRIGVNFQFWQEKGVNTWNYTSLMGDDKKKVLKNFNFMRILPSSRAKAIRQLWDRFYQVYLNLQLKNYDPQQFQFKAEDWLELFKGLYMPSDVTPYMHVLVYHISKFMEKHKQFGVKAFSCAPVEKKTINR
ncbi:hypothetical protein GLOIN_2v1784240 [Rhizophagus clarus]|uniref:Uncharacterized protein n=1 Tax=Rhizophagus clarus TaxID=94130 RepID=A0A8H3QMR2_9GLOM|nr:hypothetical protein GLOIN_2v1784240 [Rhizophagus clarus]